MVGNHSVQTIKPVLKPKGAYVGIAFSMSALLQGAWISWREGKKIGNLMAMPDQGDLASVADLLEQQTLKPVIGQCFPLEGAFDVFNALKTGSTARKVVIQMHDPNE